MLARTKKGKFVVFEGIIGSGNVVVPLVNKLVQVFDESGLTVTEAYSPDSGRLATMGAASVSTFGFGEFSEVDLLEEFKGRRKLCSSVIEPGLRLGDLVLCKNFVLSSRINIALNHPKHVKQLKLIEEYSRGFDEEERIESDLVIFVDIAPEKVHAMAMQRGPCYPKELVFYEKMRAMFLKEIIAFNYAIIEASGKTDSEIFEEAYLMIANMLSPQ